MYNRKWAIGLILGLASACSEPSTQSFTVQSAFAEAEPDGTLMSDVTFISDASARMVSDGNGTGFAYQTGAITDGGFAAFANILPTSTVTDLPDTGSVVYDAEYQISSIISIQRDGNTVTGIGPINPRGDITLTADILQGTVTGTGHALSVNGIVNGGGDLSGSVTVFQTEGALTGLAGGDQIIGAFHGDGGDVVYAGGFQGAAVPAP